ncbi:putative bifunctional P-450:NADPH-P450 reductase [Lasiosphaeria hispida]|uniref:Bifunctional cytochrome P450/NADPH--P450 reductase n=1 Tax=Lasiosphaeria hispida TaxID=260671 RepID=A0AAJ0HGZ0_9PEZI|nr:putative bifunctional P-450:NADPH-P450 reductase [Lasiosphaeria hispida]
MSEPIPEPPGWPILGNAFEIDLEFPLGTFNKWADQYGDLFRVRFPGRDMVFVTSQALVHELCDEKRFQKGINAALLEVRHGVHDGLFTARLDEPNWGIAHRVLMPAFGPMPIQSMFSEMHEIATQLTLKWARHGPDERIMVTDDFTRLTLDILSLCAMNFRFNSFYHDEMHPFITAMGDFLVESGRRSQRPPVMGFFYRAANQKFADDIDILRSTAESVLEARKAHPTDRKDLLAAMLDGVDPKTGLKMTDKSIIDNLITFLIAGHETTSGLLSFAFYQLIKHPKAYAKAQKEVDEVIGTGTIRPEHMNKLPYINAILRETLRLNPTIPLTGVEAKQDEVIGGKYFIPKGQPMALLLAKVHLDPAVHGDTANDFIPERMLDENFDRLSKEFPDFWKPFGNGQRACIGRPFAWQEALLVMAMLLQNFDFTLEDPDYELQYKQTLTTKPKGFYMRGGLRNGLTPTELTDRLSGGSPKPAAAAAARSTKTKPQAEGKPMSIYYGSNTGTCEALAQRLALDATAHGYAVTVLDTLDAAADKLPKDRPVVILTASYEGQPPDNAIQFTKWLEGLKGDELEGVSYSVYGCGHRDWAQTFHRVPKLVDETIEARGGSRISALGVTDAANGEMFENFEQWEDEVFWPAIEEKYGVVGDADGEAFSPGISVQFSAPRSSTLRQDVKEAVVLDTKVLTGPGAGEKKHIEIQLPSDMTYRPGDYLAVLPINPVKNVNRAMRRFNLAWDSHITIEADAKTTLPTSVPVPAYDVLGAYVELAQPATKRSILALASLAPAPTIAADLTTLAGPSYTAEISRKRVSVLDLLERFPSIPLPFSSFLALLPPMRVRQYSISSSPLRDPHTATLTYSLLSSPSLADPTTEHVGVASSYLASLAKGDRLNVSVRPSHSAFHLPEEPEKTPVVLIAAGAGLAPFRGFVQERAAQIAAGRTLAEAFLFFGCRSETDDLYREEFDRWEKMDAVKVMRAYSRVEGGVEGCKRVDERLWKERETLMGLWDKGAKIYVCGSRGVGESVKKAVVKIAMDGQRGKVERGESEQEPDEKKALRWFEGIRNERYATDVFD